MRNALGLTTRRRRLSMTAGTSRGTPRIYLLGGHRFMLRARRKAAHVRARWNLGLESCRDRPSGQTRSLSKAGQAGCEIWLRL